MTIPPSSKPSGSVCRPCCRAALLEQCASALEAQDLAREAREDGLEIAVLVTDEIMPDRRGHQLLEAMVAIFPDVRAVMLTGQAGAEDVGAAVNTGALHGFIAKPWTGSELELGVRRALEHWEDARRLVRAQRMQSFLLEGDPNGVVMLDQRDRVIAWNAAAASMRPGLRAGEGLPAAPGVDVSALKEEARSSHQRQAVCLTEHAFDGVGGRSRLLAHRVFGPGPEGSWVYRMTDVTETVRGREALERTLAEFADQQRREALGLMTGALVHDFRNVLLVLSNSAEFLLEEAPPESDLADEASVVAESVEHARKLVDGVLGFSRHTAPEEEVFELVPALKALHRLLRRLPSARARVSLAPSDSKNRVRMVHGHLEQIVMNLVKNALETGPDVQVVLEVREEPHAQLLVRDDGPGMDETTATRLFEPFFTTKAAESGTGLGLATCLRLAEQAGETLSLVETGPQGTTFALSLPVVDAR